MSDLTPPTPPMPPSPFSSQLRIDIPPDELEALLNSSTDAPEGTPEPPAPPSEEPGEGAGETELPDEGTPAPEPTPEPAPEPVPEPSPEPSPAPPSDLTPDQIVALTNLRDAISTDPVLQQLITDHLARGQGYAAPAATSPGPAAPPELDLEDPTVRALYNLIQTQAEAINSVQHSVQQTQAQFLARTQAESNATFRRAAQSFQAEHDLTDEDMQTLSGVAARMNIIPSLLTQGIDPRTGLPSPPDPLRAVYQAYEIAYYSLPQYRERAFTESVKRQQADAQRKKNLGAVASSGGSVSRTPPRIVPGSPEARQAMIAEVAQAAFNGSN